MSVANLIPLVYSAAFLSCLRSLLLCWLEICARFLNEKSAQRELRSPATNVGGMSA